MGLRLERAAGAGFIPQQTAKKGTKTKFSMQRRDVTGHEDPQLDPGCSVVHAIVRHSSDHVSLFLSFRR